MKRVGRCCPTQEASGTVFGPTQEASGTVFGRWVLSYSRGVRHRVRTVFGTVFGSTVFGTVFGSP